MSLRNLPRLAVIMAQEYWTWEGQPVLALNGKGYWDIEIWIKTLGKCLLGFHLGLPKEVQARMVN